MINMMTKTVTIFTNTFIIVLSRNYSKRFAPIQSNPLFWENIYILIDIKNQSKMKEKRLNKLIYIL